MADKYLRDSAGDLQEVEATTTSAGVADAGKIPALGADGKFDPSLYGAGVGGSATTMVASETLVAGDFVNIWDDGGTAKMRKADATTAAKRAHGFVLAGVASGASDTVYFEGANTALTGLTPGQTYFLSKTTPGGVSATEPAAPGIGQPLGAAYSPTALDFERQRIIIKA